MYPAGENKLDGISIEKLEAQSPNTEKMLDLLIQSGYSSSIALKSNYKLRDSFHKEHQNSGQNDKNCCFSCLLI